MCTCNIHQECTHMYPSMWAEPTYMYYVYTANQEISGQFNGRYGLSTSDFPIGTPCSTFPCFVVGQLLHKVFKIVM